MGLQVSTSYSEFLLPNTNVIHAIYCTILAILVCIVMGLIIFLNKKKCNQDFNLQRMISTFSRDKSQCEEPQYDEVRSYKENINTSFKLKENEAYV